MINSWVDWIINFGWATSLEEWKNSESKLNVYPAYCILPAAVVSDIYIYICVCVCVCVCICVKSNVICLFIHYRNFNREINGLINCFHLWSMKLIYRALYENYAKLNLCFFRSIRRWILYQIFFRKKNIQNIFWKIEKMTFIQSISNSFYSIYIFKNFCRKILILTNLIAF